MPLLVSLDESKITRLSKQPLSNTCRSSKHILRPTLRQHPLLPALQAHPPPSASYSNCPAYNGTSYTISNSGSGGLHPSFTIVCGLEYAVDEDDLVANGTLANTLYDHSDQCAALEGVDACKGVAYHYASAEMMGQDMPRCYLKVVLPSDGVWLKEANDYRAFISQ